MLVRCKPFLAAVAIGMLAGCGGSESQNADSRQAAAQAYEKGVAAFSQRDYVTAEQQLSVAIQNGLGADAYSDAAIKRVVCWGSAGKYEEAYAELDRLEAGAPNLDQVAAARSYVLAKQGKAAESRAALAKARQYNRTVQEFKD